MSQSPPASEAAGADARRGALALRAFGGEWRYLAIAFLVSLALLNAQVTVTRLLAYRFFYHFVFFVISLAQLGLAASGAWVYASRRDTWRRRDLVRWLLALGALPLVVLAGYAWLGPRPNLSFGKLDGPAAYGYLAILAVLLVALNFAGGMALTLLFTSFKEKFGRLYASDLVGAALGCLASVGLMVSVGPIRAFLVSGVAGVAAALLLVSPKAGGASRPPNRLLLGVAGVLLLLLAGAAIRPEVFDPYVRLPRVAERILRSEWTHVARTDATRAGRYVIDGDASTDIMDGGVRPPAPGYMLVPNAPDVAIIGVGAGPQLRTALANGAASVLAIDINPTILRWSLEDDRYTNRQIFHDASVEVKLGEGRHALRSSARDFDLIVMHAIDTWTASSQGAYSLSENFLYTSEAMSDLLSQLRPEGVVSIRRWLFWPPRENLRLFTTILDSLERSGVDRPERNVVVVSPLADFRDPNRKVWGFVFFSPSPIEGKRLSLLDRYVAASGWRYLYRPGRRLETPFQEYVDATDRGAFHASYPYIVTPARDSNPFFFQFAPPWSSWSENLRVSRAIYSQSSTLLVLCLALAVAMTIVLLGTPLFLRRGDLSGDRQIAPSLLYFGCLGLGFMAFELPVIQVMTLFLGHPTYALSVVLMGLLASAGLGSHLMGRARPAVGRAATVCAIALAVGSGVFLLPAVHALIHLPDAARFGLTFVYLTAIGIPLGMPFVSGVQLLDSGRVVRIEGGEGAKAGRSVDGDPPGTPTVAGEALAEDQVGHKVAWAWAVNGATAVVGSCLLMILMVYAGSGASFGLAAGCYAVALIARRGLERRRPDEPG